MTAHPDIAAAEASRPAAAHRPLSLKQRLTAALRSLVYPGLDLHTHNRATLCRCIRCCCRRRAARLDPPVPFSLYCRAVADA